MMNSTKSLRGSLVRIALKWQSIFGVSPPITSTLSELDAALLVGCKVERYIKFMKNRTAVSKGHDFIFNGKKYQVKANRPSGKKGSKVTLVPRAKNYDWDYLVWILYDVNYNIEEAWLWNVDNYKKHFSNSSRLSPADMRKGRRLNKP